LPLPLPLLVPLPTLLLLLPPLLASLLLLLLLPLVLLLPAGVAHGAWNNELELLSAVRELVTYLPLSNRCA
jgi:hypothetical protein